jgi:very-short-patch-repair endonuclease
MTRIFNRTEEKEKRRKLRSNMTNAEKLLWERIRNRQIRNKRFLRQYGVVKYIIDFYCPEIKLAIEVDGETHCSDEEIEYDKNRQTEIENFGIRFLRIKNEEVFGKIDKVILKIETFIDGTPLNPPFCKGGK